MTPWTELDDTMHSSNTSSSADNIEGTAHRRSRIARWKVAKRTRCFAFLFRFSFSLFLRGNLEQQRRRGN